MKSIIQTILAFFLGLFLVSVFNFEIDSTNTIFLFVTYLLLAIGLYSSVYGIDIKELKEHGKLVLSAVTIGVIFKTFFIGGVFYLIFRSPLAFVFAVIVAQIDPLGTAQLMSSNKHLSKTGQTIIRAWSSFDDPMTVLISIYFVLPFLLEQGRSFFDYVIGFIFNLALALGVYLLNKFVVKKDIYKILLLVICLVLCAFYQFMLAIAIIALFLRPQKIFNKTEFEPILGRILTTAFLLSTLIFGAFAKDGINILWGAVVGILVVISQIVATYFITNKLNKKDRVNIAFAQYNGITSILLAVFFQGYFDGVVSVIISALVFINLIYYFNNSIFKPRIVKT
jgi:hypothetical protein